MEIDVDAFSLCKFEKLVIKDSDLIIRGFAFACNEKANEIIISNSNVEMQQNAFTDVGRDMEVTFTDCQIKMEKEVFKSSGVVSLTISGSEVEFGEESFENCEDLVNVEIGANNIRIGEGAFSDCWELKNFIIAEDSKDDDLEIYIDECAFKNSSVQNVVIGRGKATICKEAFKDCIDILSVELLGTSLEVEANAFDNCSDELVIKYDGNQYDKDSIESIND